MALSLLSEAQVKNLFGSFSYTNIGKGRICIDPAWVQANLVEVDVPQLHSIPGAPHRIMLHKLISGQFLGAVKEMERQGLLTLIRSFDGSWVPRHMNWSNVQPLSRHSWGTAVDLNARWNGYGAHPPNRGEAGSVRALVPIFEGYGFIWGGSWKKPDGMHFEVAEIQAQHPSTGAPPPPEELFTIVETIAGGWSRLPAKMIAESLWSPVRPLVVALLGEDTVHAEHLQNDGKVYVKQKTLPL